MTLSPDRATVRETAARATKAGLVVIPPREDGTKAPEGQWGHWRESPPSVEQLRAWYANGRAGVGIATDRARLLDFDDADTYQVFRDTAEASGLADLVSRIEAGYHETTPDDGHHWLFYCDAPIATAKLARRPAPTDDEPHKVETLIEVKADGGYAVIAPSGGPVHPTTLLTGRAYELISGSIETIATITEDEYRLLAQLAAAFDELPKEEFRESNQSAAADEQSPGNDFTRRTDWVRVIGPHGWRQVGRRGAVEYWRRPGKDRGISATVNGPGVPADRLYVFTSSTTLEPNRGYSRFQAYAFLEHAGDFSAAAKRLRADGYGGKSTSKTIRQITVGGKSGDPDSESSDATGGQPKRFRLTDTGNAERLVHRHGSEIRFNWRRDVWHIWDGQRWKEDQTGEIEQLAKATCRLIPEEAEGTTGEIYQKIIMWAAKSEDAGKRRSMARLAQSEFGIPVMPNELDTDPWLLNVTNGTLDLRTGVLGPHRKEDLITRMVETPYEPDATCPTFDAFLLQIMSNDHEMVTYIQRLIGYSLTGITREQIMVIAHGTGANGKTTLLSTFRELLGEYAREADAESFMDKKHPGIREDIADLDGARFVTASETSDGKRLSEALVKKMTGGERLRARRLYENGYEFVPQFKPWLATNHQPQIHGTEHAIWRRIKLLPFSITISDDQKDPDLPVKLKAEYPGILAWAVRGCLDWQEHGLPAPPASEIATDLYRKSMDPIADWLDVRCALEAHRRELSTALYSDYLAFCQINNDSPIARDTFAAKLSERGLGTHRGAQGKRFRTGICLLPDGTTPRQSEASLLETASPASLFPETGDAGDAGDAVFLNPPRETSNTLVSGNAATGVTGVTCPENHDLEDDDEPDF